MLTDKILQGNQTDTQNTYTASKIRNDLKLQKIWNMNVLQNNELKLTEYLKKQNVYIGEVLETK
jgi:hypothetical protein